MYLIGGSFGLQRKVSNLIERSAICGYSLPIYLTFIKRVLSDENIIELDF